MYSSVYSGAAAELQLPLNTTVLLYAGLSCGARHIRPLLRRCYTSHYAGMAKPINYM